MLFRADRSSLWLAAPAFWRMSDAGVGGLVVFETHLASRRLLVRQPGWPDFVGRG
jgi:hypothetical protein